VPLSSTTIAKLTIEGNGTVVAISRSGDYSWMLRKKGRGVIAKTINYTNFNGEEVSEVYYFHLSKAELVEMEMAHDGGLKASLERLIASEDGAEIIKEFKGIILGSYGKRTPDGRRFIKTQELRDEFESSEAYSTLFMELVTEVSAAVDFISGIVPAGLADDAARVTRADLAIVPPEENGTPQLEPEILSRQKLLEIPQEEYLRDWAPRIAKGEVVLGE
jgi:hypothetical protein